ncbi:hypothetical protein [Aquimarina celericrescens]|uniref:Uncharacterized protein n=1 Tax=Aquimarina celericrescens TaxID=1964542 RepID=A0ABW5AUB0_9FLAO|nr:hypothetical protein [Aquimarina celericrescens]
MYVSENHPLPKENFEALADTHGLHCVSIYLPMHKTGKEQNEHLAQANLKRSIKDVHQALAAYQMHESEIKKYLKPIEELITNTKLWRNPSDGLAIFLGTRGLSYYTLPIVFETTTYVSDHFYLKPLLPLYYGDGLYYVLELSQDYIKLYEASRYNFKDLFIEDFVPDQLEKVVGFDYKPKMLQFRSGQATHGGSFHGHGEGKDDTIKELQTFFRTIDKGIHKVLSNRQAPLVLACVDSLYPVYKEVNSHPNLYDKNISGDPEFRNKIKLHEQSWKVIQEYFEMSKKKKITRFTELYNTPKTAYEISDIVPAALQGKIDTLFIQNGVDIFGRYNKENMKLTVHDKNKIGDASLINLTALQTFIKGGEIYFLGSDEMPIKNSPMNALFRY